MRSLFVALALLAGACGGNEGPSSLREDAGGRDASSAPDAPYNAQCDFIPGVEACGPMFECSSTLSFDDGRECVRAHGRCMLAAREAQRGCYEEWGCVRALDALECIAACERDVFDPCLDAATTNAELDHCRGPVTSCYYACGTERQPSSDAPGRICF